MWVCLCILPVWTLIPISPSHSFTIPFSAQIGQGVLGILDDSNESTISLVACDIVEVGWQAWRFIFSALVKNVNYAKSSQISSQISPYSSIAFTFLCEHNYFLVHILYERHFFLLKLITHVFFTFTFYIFIYFLKIIAFFAK